MLSVVSLENLTHFLRGHLGLDVVRVLPNSLFIVVPPQTGARDMCSSFIFVDRAYGDALEVGGKTNCLFRCGDITRISGLRSSSSNNGTVEAYGLGGRKKAML